MLKLMLRIDVVNAWTEPGTELNRLNSAGNPCGFQLEIALLLSQIQPRQIDLFWGAAKAQVGFIT